MATGPVGGGMAAQGITADICCYAKQKVHLPMAVDGAFVSVSNDSNQVYYGKPGAPTRRPIVKEDIGIEAHAASEPL